MTKFDISVLFILAIVIVSCSTKNLSISKENSLLLTAKQKKELTHELDLMGKLDQKYRAVLLLGTMDKEILERDALLSQTATPEEYIKFIKSVEKTLTQSQRDSLWELQQKIDLQNYQKAKSIIRTYGYPSSKRLDNEVDIINIIISHPPTHEVEPDNYLNEMTKLLLPEVKANRMDASDFASFYDNIKFKVLKQSQLYGTNPIFDTKTMSMGPPRIKNIGETNQARKEIGMPILKEGEYVIE